MLRINNSYFYSKRFPRSQDYSRGGWFHRTLGRGRQSSIPHKTSLSPYSGVLVPRFSLPPAVESPVVSAPRPDVKVVPRKRLLSWARAFAQKQKDWIKLNIAYLTGTAVGTAAAFVNSYLARRMGVDPTTAATAVASVSQYVFGISTVCVSWFFLQKDKYAGHTKKWLGDSAKIIGSTLLAQGITWAATWPLTALTISLGASNALAVTLQTQVFDRAVYIPLFNLFNRKRVKEMKELSAQKASADGQ